MTHITKAIQSLRPNSKWSINGDDYSGLEWKDESVKPTESEIQAEIARLQAEYDAKQYQRDRASEYPSIQEQMDMQYWDAINGTTTWLDAINAVKTKYPKGA
jgi:FKBP-type peptidyl-prolyl cis-trans isomerase (trigger factor)